MLRETFRPASLVMLTALCCVSCQGGKPCYPVRGQVAVNGKAPEGVLVVFHPVEDPDPNAAQPSGVVQADGSFSLRTFFVKERVLRDGAPPGKYRVTCVWYPADLQKHLGQEKLPDRLQGRYADARTSACSPEVQEKENELSPYQLTAPER